jgi:hypothetical protein
MSYFDLFMLQNIVVCPVHEYMNVNVCEAFSNRLSKEVTFYFYYFALLSELNLNRSLNTT